MRKFTKKSAVAQIVTPLHQLAADMVAYFETYDTVKPGYVMSLRGCEIIVGERAPRERSPLTNHRRLQIKALIDRGETEELLPLRDLLSGIPPLTGQGKGLVMHVSEANGMYMWIGLDGIEIFRGSDLKTLVHQLYTFIRIHENLDMDVDLELFQAFAQAEPHPLYFGANLLADTAENALLRFAACDPDIQSQIRKNKPVACWPVDSKKRSLLAKAIGGRTRVAPAEPKSWNIL